jgi:ubiquinone/menaquinone biosynthesis C-methylase UbiE
MTEGAAAYPIRGGLPGRERLRVLSRVLRPSTNALLTRAGLRRGMTCLDAGCGGGDVAFDMARTVGVRGKVAGTDIDEAKLAIARSEARQQGLFNVEFFRADLQKEVPPGVYDLAHARFLLTHLPEPAAALANLRTALRPGGAIVLEDVDFTGYFCHPEVPAFRRYVELYTALAARRGGDPNIGRRLPELAAAAGFEDVEMNVVQHASTHGDVRLVSALTMENIADAVVAEGLAAEDEVAEVVAEMHRFAAMPGAIGATPRVFEVWARRP